MIEALSYMPSPGSAGLWIAAGIVCGVLTVIMTLRFGLTGFIIMAAVIVAISAAILGTI
jgi:hypothetical protein